MTVESGTAVCLVPSSLGLGLLFGYRDIAGGNLSVIGYADISGGNGCLIGYSTTGG